MIDTGLLFMEQNKINDIVATRELCRINEEANHRDLSENQWYFTDLVENANVGIVVFDFLKEQIAAMNKIAKSYFCSGVKPKDYHTLYNLFLKPFHNQEMAYEQYLPRARQITYGSRTFGYTIHPMSGGYLGMFVLDITQKEHLKKLEKSREFIHELDAIFSGISETMQHPAKALQKELTDLRKDLNGFAAEEQKAKLDRALKHLRQIEKVVSAVAEFESFYPQNLHLVDLVVFMKKFIRMLQPLLKDREIELATVLPDRQALSLIDPELFKRALLNIFTNALEATAHSEHPQITVSVFQNNGRNLITIEDNGHGVPPLLSDKLFYPFYTSKIGALGLGMTATRKIITMLNGEITVKSIHKVGTVVEISLADEAVVAKKQLT